MRIGSFWGLPAPMIILLFEDDKETLKKYLMTASNDTKKEFIFLSKIGNLKGYKAPKVEKVSEDLSPFCEVVNGKIDGESEMVTVQLEAEIRSLVLEKIIKLSLGGKWKKVPESLMGVIDGVVKSMTFTPEDLKMVSNKVVKKLEDSDSNTMSEWAKACELEVQTPSEIDFNGKKVVLSQNQKNALAYYQREQEFIEDCALHCAGKVVEEYQIFKVSFFDIALGKTSRIAYMVSSMFEQIADRRDPKYLINLVELCKEEIEKFKFCFDKFVCSSEESSVKQESIENNLRELDQCTRSVSEYFVRLIEEGKLDVTELTEENFRMLIDLKGRINELTNSYVLDKLGCEGSIDSVAKELMDVGIIGINGMTSELFDDAMVNFVLDNDSHIIRSESDVEEVKGYLRDIDALLSTLRPIGGKIDE